MYAHVPVLLQESVSALVTDLNGTYLDCTLGRAGHSKAILEKLSKEAKLHCLDKDIAAIDYAAKLFAQDHRVSLHHSSFAKLSELNFLNTKFDGILLDLGVSSPQLDDPSRGFSFNKNGPLDMRMDNTKGILAHEWLNSVDEESMIKVFFAYGEEKFARKIARAIIKRRDEKKFLETLDLANFIKDLLPFYEKGKHPATRVFQAIRIKINNELDDLKTALTSAINMLKPKGKLAVISFHSLEDRIVKTTLRELATVNIPINIPITKTELMAMQKLTIEKKIKPTSLEIARNKRARSAILRIATRK